MLCEPSAFSICDHECHDEPAWTLDRNRGLFPSNGPSSASAPTIAFRLALALRRCGDAAEAEAFFSWSRRLMAERYVAHRMVVRQCSARLAALAEDASAE